MKLFTKLFEKINATTHNTTSTKVIPIQTNEPKANNVGVSSFWKYAAAAAIVLLIGSTAYNFTLQSKYDAIAKNLQENKQEIALLKERNDFGS